MITDKSFEHKKLKKRVRRRKVEKISLSIPCSCSVCKYQSHTKPETSYQSFRLPAGTQKSYTWLLEQLGEISSHVPVKLSIPETAIYRNRKPISLIGQYKDGSIRATVNSSNLKNSHIRKAVIDVLESRKKNPEANKSAAVVRYMTNDNTHVPVLPAEEEGALRVMSTAEFSHMMDERPGSSVWKSMNYLQAALNCKQGLGPTFMYHYDCNDTELPQPAAKECNLIAYYIGHFTSKTLIQMDAEFMTDDSGKLWLFYAKNIVIEENSKILDRENKDMGFLEEPIFISEKKICKHGLEMAKKMKEHYENIKHQVGIDPARSGIPKRKKSRLFSLSSVHLLGKQKPKIEMPKKQKALEMTEIHTTVKFTSNKKNWRYTPALRIHRSAKSGTINLPSRSVSRILSNTVWRD